ncbi:MAG: class I SAM-dependent methyltransferase [Thermodesulfobacteriota bacterium]
MSKIDISKHNAHAWNEESIEESPWCTPVSSEEIQAAKNGDVRLRLTPNKFVPNEWIKDIKGREVLCVGSGGGQQAPIIAAAGANVISVDISEEQLKKDLFVANRDGLKLLTVMADMSDLSDFKDSSFDYVVNAASTVFVPDVEKVWKEFFRVLKPGGELLAGMLNPSFFLFDHAEAQKKGVLEVKHNLPYSDVDSLNKTDFKRIIDDEVPIVWSHSLQTLIGGQTKAGFVIMSFYEDWWSGDDTLLNKFSPTTFVTRSKKPD